MTDLYCVLRCVDMSGWVNWAEICNFCQCMVFLSVHGVETMLRFGTWASWCDGCKSLETKWLFLLINIFFSWFPLLFPLFLALLPSVFISPAPVWRLSAAAFGEDFAQYGDGESRRRLDGSRRVSGQERSMQRWAKWTHKQISLLSFIHTHTSLTDTGLRWGFFLGISAQFQFGTWIFDWKKVKINNKK